MDKKAQLEFEMEDVAAAICAIIAGGLAVFVTRGSGTGAFWKIATFGCTVLVAFFVTRAIFNK